MRPVLLAFGLALASVALGQPVGTPAYTLDTRHFDALDGLSANRIHHVERDAAGFLWVATAKGLDRYDGNRFENHLYADMVRPEQRANQVLIHLHAASDSLFHLCLSQDPLFLGKDTLVAFSPLRPDQPGASLLQEDSIRQRSFHLGGRPLRWEYTSEQKDSMKVFWRSQPVSPSFVWAPRKWNTWTGGPSDHPILFRTLNGQTDILQWSDSLLLHRTSPHFTHLAPTQGDPRPLILANGDSGLTFIKANATGGWPAGTILHLDRQGKTTRKGDWADWLDVPSPAKTRSTFIKINPVNGHLWCFTEDEFHLFDRNGDRLLQRRISDNAQYGSLIQCIRFTSASEAWVGTWKGLDWINLLPDPFDAVFQSTPDQSGEKRIDGINGCRGIVELGVDTFAFATNGSGIRLHRGNTHLQLLDDRGLGGGLLLRGDTLFTASVEGIGCVPPASPYQILIPLNLRKAFWTLARWQNQWLIGSDGVLAVDQTHGHVQPFGEWPEGSTGNVYQIEVQGDTLWAMGSAGIHRWVPDQENQWRPWHEVNPLAPEVPECHHRFTDGFGHTWISTASSGLIRWTESNGNLIFLGPEHGLPSTTVYGGFQDQTGTLWFSTDNGLFRLDPFTLEAEVFDERHGLHETEFNRTGHHLGTSGTAYFSTINGLVRFSTTDFPETNRETPPLVITRLMQHNQGTGTVEDVLAEFQQNGELFLGAEDDFVSIKFTLLDFTDAPQFFRYRTTTDERNSPSEWFAIEEPEINLNGLPAGTTRLEVQSRIRGVGWPEAGRVIPITVAAPWYANPLNILYLGVLMGLSVGLLVLTRVRILRRRNAQLEQMVEERTKDLQTSLDLQETYLQEVHHRVKNNLQIIGSLLDLQAARETSPQTRKALGTGRSRIESISLVHQHLYLHPDSRRINITDFLTEYAQRVEDALLEDEDMVDWSLSGEDIQLGIEEAQPFGLLVNELLTNSLRHAIRPDHRLSIAIAWKEAAPGVLELLYSDNGPGLSPSTDTSETDSLGLRLIHRLTGQLKGELTLDGHPRSTWTFRFQCPFETSQT